MSEPGFVLEATIIGLEHFIPEALAGAPAPARPVVAHPFPLAALQIMGIMISNYRYRQVGCALTLAQGWRPSHRVLEARLIVCQYSSFVKWADVENTMRDKPISPGPGTILRILCCWSLYFAALAKGYYDNLCDLIWPD